MTNLTRVQKYISPAASAFFSVFYLDRRSLAWGLRAVADHLGERTIDLQLALWKFDLLLPAYRLLDLRQIEHFHFRKMVKSSDLIRAANEFYETTGRSDLFAITAGVVEERRSGGVNFSARQVDLSRPLASVMPRIIGELREDNLPGGQPNYSTLIDEVYDFAHKRGLVDPDEALYRMRKMAEIGGNIQAIVASLFIDVPSADLPGLLQGLPGEKLPQLRESIARVLKSFHSLRANFVFENAQLVKDSAYLYHKMSELLQGAENPHALLLFLYDKLTAARQAKETADPIFNEIQLLYAPLAEMLGLIFLADDFRDQWLRLREPETYAMIETKVKERLGLSYASAKIFLSAYARELFKRLQSGLSIDSQGLLIKFRVKSPYSIWNKVELRREHSYREVRDILGVKIICGSMEELSAIKNLLIRQTDLFVVNTREIEDETGSGEKWRGIRLKGRDKWAEGGIPIEVQLLTQAMNVENNRGRAATWKYNLEKELSPEQGQNFPDQVAETIPIEHFEAAFYALRGNWAAPRLEIVTP